MMIDLPILASRVLHHTAPWPLHTQLGAGWARRQEKGVVIIHCYLYFSYALCLDSEQKNRTVAMNQLSE